MGDEDEDGEWVDVHHSSDEDTGELVRMKLLVSLNCRMKTMCCVDVIVIRVCVSGGEASEYSRRGKEGQSGGGQRQQAPHSR